MGDALEAGTGAEGEHSLAGYLEEEFNAVRVEAGFEPLTPEGREDRNLLFLGIARGIIRYLGDHSEAFVVESHSPTEDTEDTEGYRHDSVEAGYVRIRVDTGFKDHP